MYPEKTKELCEPLRWPEDWISPGPVRRVFRSVPVIGLDAKTRRKLLRQIRRRSPRVLDAWGDDPALLKLVAYVASVASKWLGWDSILFVPSDPWAILFWDTTTDMRTEGALLELERRLHLPRRYLFRLPDDLTFGEFIQKILEKSVWP